MEEGSGIPSDAESDSAGLRCPQCDSVLPAGSDRCIMCGASVTNVETAEPALTENVPPAQTSVTPAAVRTSIPKIGGRWSLRSWIIALLIVATFILTSFFALFVLRGQGPQVLLALQPTFTPIPPAPTLTPTSTPVATETPLATSTAVPTATSQPTDTPQPPRYHTVANGETMFGLSLFYRISADSIAESNSIPLESPIQVGQQLLIPWPTATPPLESLVLEIGGENIVADVTDCEIITIQEGDSAYGLSAQRGVPAEAIVAVNRLTDESIQLLHPGDTLCIPRVLPGDQLPPTAGPQPTATGTAFPEGPALLYPVDGAEIDEIDRVLRLQWVAVKDLVPGEQYMVEVSNLDLLDSLPFREFTADTSLAVPSEWRPSAPELHEMRWRVSIVEVTGERADGEPFYEYGGRSSEDSTFFWLGVPPTATPTMTPSPTATPE